MNRRLQVWIVVACGSLLMTAYGFWTGSRGFSDFAGYYTASRMFLSGSGSLYDDAQFVGSMQSYGIPESTFTMYVNPPHVALVMAPLAWMNPSGAKLVWNCISVVLLAIAFELLRRLFSVPWSSPVLPFLAALLACTLPFLRNLQRGQIYILLIDVLLLIARGYRDRRPVLTACGLAVMILLKFFGLVFLVLFAVERRWTEVFLTLLYVCLGTFAGLLIFGIEAYMGLFAVLLNAGSDFGTTGLPCVPALTGSLFSPHPQWNLNPVANAPVLALLLNAGLMLAMLVFTFKRTVPGLVRFSALTIMALVFTPLAADHHYAFLFLPAGLVLAREEPLKSSALTLLLTGALLFLALGWYPQPAVAHFDGWAKVLAFPRLYAALVLFFLLLKRTMPQLTPQSP